MPSAFGSVITQTNFGKGELAPRAHMRSDTRVYHDAMQTASNAALLAHGGCKRRPGTRFVTDLTDLGVIRFADFTFGPGQAYLFVFYNTGLRIYLTDGTLATTLTSQPWTAAMLPKLSFTQAGNVMVVAHQDMPMRLVRRTGSVTFTSVAFAFGSGGATAADAPSLQPYHKFFDTEAITITPSAYTGSVTVTASAAVFSAAWVGVIIRYAGTELLITAFTNATTVTATCREQLAKAYNYPVADSTAFIVGDTVRSTAGDALGVITSKPDGTHLIVLMLDRAQQFEYDAAILRYLVSGTTSAKLTAAGVVVGTPPATYRWDEQAFSAVRGYPVAVSFHEERFCIGGSRDLPTWLWLSSAGDFFSFAPGLGEDDDAIIRQITADQVSEIRHLVSHRHLHVLTDGGEFYVPQLDSQPLTPTTISLRRQTRYGSSFVRPVVFDGSTIFVQLSLKAVREFIFTETETAYTSPPLSVMSSHLIKEPVDMDAQVGADDTEEQYIFVVNTDGTLAVFHGMKKEELAGWTPWLTDGKFKAVRVVDGFVFFAVERTIGGVTKTYLERLDQTLSVDCALTVAGPTASPTVAHLPSRLLHAVAGLSYFAAWTADAMGGVQTPLSVTLTAADVGLDYPFVLKDLPVVKTEQGRNVATAMKRILKVAVWIDQSVTFAVNGHELAVYNVTDDLAAAPNPKTGAFEFTMLGWDKTAQVTITQVYPLPLTVLGLHKEVSV